MVPGRFNGSVKEAVVGEQANLGLDPGGQVIDMDKEQQGSKNGALWYS